jgi:hypothetical protein
MLGDGPVPELSDGPFYRCTHCKGFYEADLSACKYCAYEAPQPGPDGKPRLFKDRATVRAIRVAEFEQLPEEAHRDTMGPPPDEFATVCGCLHCGPGGPPFEAIEMRWHPVEGLWCCPCTTCGGRGFQMDIHPFLSKWECATCRHKWYPPDGNYKWSNCKCPKCGCTEASGFFQDEYSYEEIEAMSEEEYKAAFGKTRAEEEAEYEEMSREMERKRAAGEIEDDVVPWEDPPAGEGVLAPTEFDPSDPDNAPWSPDADAGATAGGEPKIPDDIDHPRPRRKRDPGEGGVPDDDIPY